ncbi:MAG: MlaD family protein [Pseudomonadota bacterium]
MAKQPPEVRIEPARGISRVSFIWLIPLFALAIALGVAWQSYSNQGPVITIEFENGAGIAKDETLLKYRDISVGLVEDVSFTEGLETVKATVRLEKAVAPYIDNQATFWVVRPELTARGVSGLDTVLTGVFIEGSWDNEIGEPQSDFRGLGEAPLFQASKPGLEIALRATANGQLTENAPIFFHGIEVGRVGKARISPRTNFAIAEAIIYEPHGRLITPTTRFWDTSGFSVSIGASGAEIDFTSLATLISGGLSFDTFVSGGERVADGETFQIYVDEESARNSVFNASEVETLEISVIFDDNISGLAVGAPVELSGLKIGEVQSVSGIIDRATFGDGRVRLNAILSIQPSRLGLETAPSPGAALNFLAARVRQGLRARLASASLLTGGLKVELVAIDDAPLETIPDLNVPVPVMPTTQSEIADRGSTIEGVVGRINQLPIEELLTSAIDFLNSATAFVSNEELQQAPGEVVGLLDDVRGLVTSDDMKNVPVALNALLTRMETVVQQLEQEQLVQRLVSAVDAATNAAAGVDTAVEGVPQLLAAFQSVAEKAEAFPVDRLLDELTELAGTAEQVIGSDGFKALPSDLSAALAEVEATLKAIREGGVIDNANATLASARSAADTVAAAADDLPALMTRMSSVLNQASTTIQGFDQGDKISRDVESALRDIQKAAQALASLAKTIERNPSALIRGR